jgi:hypothetical protein
VPSQQLQGQLQTQHSVDTIIIIESNNVLTIMIIIIIIIIISQVKLIPISLF